MPSPKDDPGAAPNETGGADRAGAEAAGGASIEKVRDLLFGGQLREFDRRFARLEDRIVKDHNDLKDDLKTRFSALEQFVKKEAESLADRIKAEHADRLEAQSGASRELKENVKSFEKRTAALDEQLAKSQRELRQQILEQGQRASDDIRKRADEVLKALAREAQELRAVKTDRTTLAALLTEMAMRLTDEPGADDGNG
jgi:hypothetical protein